MISMTWPQYLRSQCSVDGRVVQLSPTQTKILLLLMLRPGWVSNTELIEWVYPNPDFEPDWAKNAIQVHAHHLRRRLGIDCIESQHNGPFGYRLVRDQHLKEAA